MPVVDPLSMGLITNSLSPTQSSIIGTIQRGRNDATAPLSSSPLLSFHFVSYANRTAALGSTSSTPSPESEGRKDLQTTTSPESKERKDLQTTISPESEEQKDLQTAIPPESEGRKDLQTTIAALREEIGRLKQENLEVTGQLEMAVASKEKYDRLMVDLNAERATLRRQVSNLKVSIRIWL